ncbi:MAG TPA: hypothetical protein VGR28_05290 [Candidatus Thermoplasmatota archaeon]|jgi:hypothetical protein|nr:hypothetical protein [Candidatus Thermoplasmatota archaeon]
MLARSALVLAALLCLLPTAGAEPVCLPGASNAIICAADHDGDGLPEDLDAAAPAELYNDLGTFFVLPEARVAGDRDRDSVPEVIAATLEGGARTQDRDPGVRVGAAALDGSSVLAVGAGTGNSDAALLVGADASELGAALTLDAITALWGAGFHVEPVDLDGDGAPDHALLVAGYDTPLGAETGQWLLGSS